MLESTIETYFRKQVEAAGYRAYKFVSPGRVGVTDRIVPLPGGVLKLVELKAPDKEPRKTQLREHAYWRALGFEVFVIDSKKGVDAWIKKMC